jgi:hypothetical protein
MYGRLVGWLVLSVGLCYLVHLSDWGRWEVRSCLRSHPHQYTHPVIRAWVSKTVPFYSRSYFGFKAVGAPSWFLYWMFLDSIFSRTSLLVLWAEYFDTWKAETNYKIIKKLSGERETYVNKQTNHLGLYSYVTKQRHGANAFLLSW